MVYKLHFLFTNCLFILEDINQVYIILAVSKQSINTLKTNSWHVQTRFQKSWDTVQIVNKKGMQ